MILREVDSVEDSSSTLCAVKVLPTRPTTVRNGGFLLRGQRGRSHTPNLILGSVGLGQKHNRI